MRYRRGVRLAAFAALWVIGCGRLNFNEADRRTDGAVDVNSPLDNDAVVADAGPAVCGNAMCEGTAGELCGMCAADCAVSTIVCGNAECQAGEDGTNCFADCGPATWPWTQDETDLLTAVNAARVGGVVCPGETTTRTVPGLVATTSMTVGTREQAWEVVHHMFATGNGTSCNGRTFAQREQPYGGNGGLTAYGGITTAAMAVNIWKTNATLCPILMTAGPTQSSTGVAHEANDAYVLWFK